MAELLIYNRDTLYISDSQSYILGDIVSVCPAGHVWGKLECLPNFYIVRVSGSFIDVCKYANPVIGVDGDILLCRRYKYNVQKLSSQIRSKVISSSGLYIPLISIADIEDKSIWL